MTGRRASEAGSRTRQTRRRIALEAARLITDSGLRDYGQAKLKAAERLGIFDEGALPANHEIEDALREHQRLFHGKSQTHALHSLREAAREAMLFLAAHEPRLVGAVLDGSADEHSAVCLHLYSDHPDIVADHLRERGVPWQQQSRRLRIDRVTAREFPTLQFRAGDAAIDLTILPYNLLRQAPLDRITGKPMQRATLAALEGLLRSEGD